MAYETLLASREEGFAVVALNRPPANAISEPLVQELDAALSEFAEDDTVRALIITGAGDKIFCAGADLGSAFSGGNVDRFIRFGNSVLRRIERYPKPVIAAMNGHALGGGCEIAMACHLRLLKEGARMGQTESNLGIIPGFGGTQRMPRLIGRTKALEFMILGTQIPSEECLALGLVNRLSKEGRVLDDARAPDREATAHRDATHSRGRRRRIGSAHRPGARDRDAALHESVENRGRRGRHPGVLREARTALQGTVTRGPRHS